MDREGSYTCVHSLGLARELYMYGTELLTGVHPKQADSLLKERKANKSCKYYSVL